MTARDAFLNATESNTGDTLLTDRAWDAGSRPKSEETFNSGGTALFQQQYNWANISIGTLTQRVDQVDSVTDKFGYDALNELTSVATTTSSGGQIAKSFTYYQNGDSGDSAFY